MKTPKRKRATSVAKANVPATEARAIDDSLVDASTGADHVASEAAEADLDVTTTLPVPELMAEAAPAEAEPRESESAQAESTKSESIRVDVAPAAVAEPDPIDVTPAAVEADPVIALSSNSTVKDAAALKARLIKVAALPANISIDVRSVERVDTATFQLLCAFVRDRAERKLGVSWVGCPKAFIESSRLLGVHAMLGLPAVGVV